MKKIVNLLVVLMFMAISICGCNSNAKNETLNDNVESNDVNINLNESVNNNNLMNQNENTSNSKVTNQNETIDSLNKDNIMNETSSDSESKKVEEENKAEIKSEETINTEKTDSNQTIAVAATSLSNKKHAWGFVRKKNEVRPEFSKNYIQVLDDYEGIYAGNPEQKVIYLTFDEGYENGYTASILDTLKEKNCPATFFVTKPYVKQNQELVQRMIDEGHIVRQPHGKPSIYARSYR